MKRNFNRRCIDSRTSSHGGNVGLVVVRFDSTLSLLPFFHFLRFPLAHGSYNGLEVHFSPLLLGAYVHKNCKTVSAVFRPYDGNVLLPQLRVNCPTNVTAEVLFFGEAHYIAYIGAVLSVRCSSSLFRLYEVTLERTGVVCLIVFQCDMSVPQ